MPSERPALPTLEQQAAFLKAVAERVLPSAIVGEDLAGNVVSWSDGARVVYGYDAHEMLGKPASLLHAADELSSERAAAPYAEALVAGKWEGRVRRYRKGGSAFPAQVTLLLR
ncbi:MAG: PAS domain-containing protein, partial [Burkholderiales bacterium]